MFFCSDLHMTSGFALFHCPLIALGAFIIFGLTFGGGRGKVKKNIHNLNTFIMEENIKFLKDLHLKTTKKVPTSFTPNISEKTYQGYFFDFTDYVLSHEEFDKIFSIIEEELLLILPKENIMGYIEGYDVRDLDGELLMRFGEKNLPEGRDLRKIFLICKSNQNEVILKELHKEKKLTHIYIMQKFENYCY
jgi:hypothetical protein